jgi:hypothetical protein
VWAWIGSHQEQDMYREMREGSSMEKLNAGDGLEPMGSNNVELD